ncbi:odorant receptor 131-2-like [Engraulis encrasicolus]|uniref:odorant receptor 131-2-like n=1 Tax=Engraulis encrasicolus TaxID=184585 RepID=UPI002FD02F79
MNLTGRDGFEEALVKNIVIVAMGIAINWINGIIVLTFFRNSVFRCETRYILYMNLVVNDMTMIFFSVALYVLTYAVSSVNLAGCCALVVIGTTTHMNTPIILTGMAIERYIAICKPLHHAQICTVRRTYALIGLTWGAGLGPALIDVFISLSVQPDTFLYSSVALCHPLIIYNTRMHADKVQVLQGLYMSLVWLTLLYTYLRVFLAARAATADAASAKKAQSTILLHGAQLILCMLSYTTPYINKAFIPLFPAQRTIIMFLGYLITSIIPRLLSPLIYSIRDRKFAKCMSQYYTFEVLIIATMPLSSLGTKIILKTCRRTHNLHMIPQLDACKIPMNPYLILGANSSNRSALPTTCQSEAHELPCKKVTSKLHWSE